MQKEASTALTVFSSGVGKEKKPQTEGRASERHIWRWLWLIAFNLIAVDCFGTSLSLVGSGSYSVVGNTVVLRSDGIENNEFFGVSGTIRLELWAFSTPYPGTTVGYKLASYVVGQLSAGFGFYNINSGFIPFALPPGGTWSFSLQAREYVGFGSDGYTTRDFINFSSPVRVAGGAFFNDVQILGLTTWQVIGSTVDMYVERVLSICDFGVSGNLRLDLWATTVPFGGGTITGYRFGTISLNPLTGGFAYNNIDQTVPYFRPPDGAYYVTLTLSEYYNGSFLMVDYLNYGSPLVVGNTPLPPAANAATAVTSSGFTANWSASVGATGYRLDVSTNSTFISYVAGYENLDVGNVLNRVITGLTAGPTYYYRVRAYNSIGTSGSSGTITVTLPCTYLITTSSSGGGITSGGGIKNCGATVTVTATANPGYRFTNWVEDTTVVSAASSYTFSASANRTLIANFVDSQRPTVSITSPPTGTTYTNARTVTLTVNAGDNVGVTQVEFYDGATLAGISATIPHTNVWSFMSVDNGPHVWTARAYDAAGNVSTSSPVTLTVSIDITPPNVTISSPTNGQTVSTASITVVGTANDPVMPASGVGAVEVRVNGGNWSNAVGTTSWTRSVTLSPCGNTIEARSRDRVGSYSAIQSIAVTYNAPNTLPNRPTNSSPSSGALNVSTTPTLQASPFVDADCTGDTHEASQWQVLNTGGTIIVADSGTNMMNLIGWTVPTNKLYFGSNYQWRVRYRDNRNGWSSNSIMTTFTTGGPRLTGTKVGTNTVIRWATNALGFSLQWATNVGAGSWSNTLPLPVIVNGQYSVTNSASNSGRFYRLKK